MPSFPLLERPVLVISVPRYKHNRNWTTNRYDWIAKRSMMPLERLFIGACVWSLSNIFQHVTSNVPTYFTIAYFSVEQQCYDKISLWHRGLRREGHRVTFCQRILSRNICDTSSWDHFSSGKIFSSKISVSVIVTKHARNVQRTKV